MKISFKSIIKRVLRITVFTVAVIFLSLFLAPILFPGTIADSVKQFANSRLDGELNFSKTRLFFSNHFSSFTFSLYYFSLKNSFPFNLDTLVNFNSQTDEGWGKTNKEYNEIVAKGLVDAILQKKTFG